MKKLSIKLRVTVWYTAFLTILTAIMLAVMFAVSEYNIKTSSRDTLIGLVENAGFEIEYDDGKLEEDKDLILYSNGAYAAVYDAFGSDLLIGSLPPDFPGNVSYTDREVVVTTGWYVYDAVHNIDGYGSVIIRGVMQRDATVSLLSTIVWLSAILFPFIIIAAAIGGYFIAKRAFLPVRDITSAAERIKNADDLSGRINLGEGKDEIYTLAKTFDSMFDRLEQGFKNEKQFTSDAAHELRTPVSVIISQCEYAIENASTAEEARKALETVLERAESMSALISKLLTLARADNENIKSTFEKLNFSELARMCADEITELAKSKNITVTADIKPDIYIEGNETLLMRLVLNLMENGIKYGRENGNLKLTITQTEKGISGKVLDDGIGIDADKLPLIWNRFYQVDSSRSENLGAGLGLSMVKYIAVAHGGAVSVTSTKDKGTTFYFELPSKKF